MLIDWFTVAAQAINFLILVGLLKFFLYGRILQAIDQREADFQSRSDAIEEQRKAVESASQDYQNQLREIDVHRDAMLAKTQEEAEAQRQALLKNAREDLSRMRDDWATALKREQQEFLYDLRQQITRESLTLARSLMEKMAGVDLENRMVEVLLQQFSQMDDSTRRQIAAVLEKPDQSVVLRSAFELSQESVTRIETSFQSLTTSEAPIQLIYEVEPGLVCGAEIEVDGHRLGWSFDDQLERIEELLSESIEEEIRKSQGDRQHAA